MTQQDIKAHFDARVDRMRELLNAECNYTVANQLHRLANDIEKMTYTAKRLANPLKR